MSYGQFISGTILHQTLYNLMIISNGSAIGISYIWIYLMCCARDPAELIKLAGTSQTLSIYVIINKTCLVLRPHQKTGGPLGPAKNLRSIWLHQIPFCLKAKRFDCQLVYHPVSSAMTGGIQLVREQNYNSPTNL